jgi:hypothetical protein
VKFPQNPDRRQNSWSINNYIGGSKSDFDLNRLTYLVKEVHSAGGLGSSTLIVRSDGVGAVLLIVAAVVRFAFGGAVLDWILVFHLQDFV